MGVGQVVSNISSRLHQTILDWHSYSSKYPTSQASAFLCTSRKLWDRVRMAQWRKTALPPSRRIQRTIISRPKVYRYLCTISLSLSVAQAAFFPFRAAKPLVSLRCIDLWTHIHHSVGFIYLSWGYCSFVLSSLEQAKYDQHGWVGSFDKCEKLFKEAMWYRRASWRRMIDITLGGSHWMMTSGGVFFFKGLQQKSSNGCLMPIWNQSVGNDWTTRISWDGVGFDLMRDGGLVMLYWL